MNLSTQLNETQHRIVTELDHNILLQAPAGTGKTAILAHRIAYILACRRAREKEILCLTFTNRACKELQHRLQELIGLSAQNVTIKTIHAFGYLVLQEEGKKNAAVPYDSLIYDEEDCRHLLASLIPANYQKSPYLLKISALIEKIKKNTAAVNEPAVTHPDAYVFSRLVSRKYLSSLCENYNGTPNPRLENWLVQHGLALYRQYNQCLRQNHALDFNDLILQAHRLLQQPEIRARWQTRFRYLTIDEIQDTSDWEYAFLSPLFPEKNLLFCGDAFQTIYEWRGSHPDFIFADIKKKYHPLCLTLTTNYRAAPPLVQAAADCLQALFPDRQSPKILAGTPVDATLEPIQKHSFPTYLEEGAWIFKTIQAMSKDERRHVCIMTRTNRQNKQLWLALRACNARVRADRTLPFSRIEQFHLFKRQEIKDILAFLRLIINKNDALSMHRIAQRFIPHLGHAVLRQLEGPAYKTAGIHLSDFSDPRILTAGDPFGLLLHHLQEGSLIVFDVESTGTNPLQDEIIQIAAVRLRTDGTIQEKFMTYLRPSRTVGDSYAIHGLSDEFLQKNGTDARRALQNFLTFAKDSLIVGHNVLYDISILQSELSRLSLPCPTEMPYMDTLDIYRRFYPDLEKYTLEFLSHHFSTAHKPSHNAWDDILATADLLQTVLQEKILSQTATRRELFTTYAHRFISFSEKISALRRQSYSLRPHELLTRIMLHCGVKEYYAKIDEQEASRGEPSHRLDHIRYFYRLAAEPDDPSRSPRDNLQELLQLASLSNSELDTLLQKKEQIPIITVHQAKGLEYDTVFLAALQDGTFPLSRPIQTGNLDEEKRLFYVAITRAKKKLYLTWHEAENHIKQNPSRFLQTLPLTAPRD